MKTVKDLQAERDEILGLDRGEFTPRQYSAAKKKLQFLSTCINYLKSKPDEGFLTRQADRMTRRLELIHKDFNNFQTNKSFDSEQKKLEFYLKECNVPQLKLHIKTIKYILS